MSENSNTNPPAIPNATELILKLLTKKSGVSVPSDMRENLIRYLSGTFQGPSVRSEDEIYAENAPTFLKIQAYEPEGSLRKTIAGMVLQNMPEAMIVEKVREIGAANPQLLGTGTDKEWASFVGQLVTEHDKAQTAMADEATKQDFFQKQGLPSATQQYTAEDIMNLAPDAFAALSRKAEQGRPAYDERAAEIDKKLGQPVMMQLPNKEQLQKRQDREDMSWSKTEDTRRTAALIGQQWGLDESQVKNPDRSDMRQVAANEAYLTLLRVKGKSTPKLIDTGAELGGGFGIPRTLFKGALAVSPLRGAKDFAGTVGDILSWRPGKAEQEAYKAKQEIKKNTVVDPIATARMLAAANAAKDRIGRQPGNPMYFEDAAKRLVTNIQQQAQTQGRNPLIDAVLRDLITKKAISGG